MTDYHRLLMEEEVDAYEMQGLYHCPSITDFYCLFLFAFGSGPSVVSMFVGFVVWIQARGVYCKGLVSSGFSPTRKSRQTS